MLAYQPEGDFGRSQKVISIFVIVKQHHKQRRCRHIFERHAQEGEILIKLGVVGFMSDSWFLPPRVTQCIFCGDDVYFAKGIR